MELQKRQDQGLPQRKVQKRKPEEEIKDEQRKGQKRKLEEDIKDEQPEISPSPVTCSDARDAILLEVAAQVNILDSAFSCQEADRAAAKRATHVLADLAKNDEVVSVIVEGGAVPALVKHLQAPPSTETTDTVYLRKGA